MRGGTHDPGLPGTGRSATLARVGTHRRVESPIGPLTLVSDGTALTGLYVQEPGPEHGPPGDDDVLDDVAGRLDAYFAGERPAFDDVPLAPRGTAFQRAVWDALRAVPYGTTTTYGALAVTIGRPSATRAVGTANARNPISLLVPCHRVLTAAGHPSGGGPGAARKLWLQALERDSAVACG